MDYNYVNIFAAIGICILYFFTVCMVCSLAMQIDISSVPNNIDIITSSNPYLHYMLSNNNTFLNTSSCLNLLNWAVVMLYFTQTNTTSINIFCQVYRLAKSPKLSRLKKFENLLSYYTTLLNLMLIVLVTPSIVNPGPTKQSDLKVGYCNAQGFILMSSMKGQMPIFQTNKIMDVQSYVYTNELDIVIINESWLNEYINSN